MFCKNARTKIAMASPEPEPTALHNQMSAAQAAAPEPTPRLDPSHILMDNAPDPTLQMLLRQQLAMCNQMNIQQRLAQMQLHQNTMPTKPPMVTTTNASAAMNSNSAALNLL